MSREGGKGRESQSKKAISPHKSKVERSSQQSAEISTATSDVITQQSAHSITTSPTPLHRREEQDEDSTRNVIAVSASKGPAAFFNLARKFLAKDEICDLSALEGAIVSAVDAAHLLERSKLATIERIQTSYITVEPKRKKGSTTQISAATAESGEQIPQESFKSIPSASYGTPTPASAIGAVAHQHSGTAAVTHSPSGSPTPVVRSKKSKGGASSEVRRARIIITVKRTPEYKQWLLDNPIPDISAGDDEDPDVDIIGTSVQPKS